MGVEDMDTLQENFLNKKENSQRDIQRKKPSIAGVMKTMPTLNKKILQMYASWSLLNLVR